jgi:hypothetical protein
MKVLFLFHPYGTASMSAAICEVSETVFCPTKRKKGAPAGMRPMNWREFFSLRRRILAHEFDYIISYGCEEGLWRANRSFLKNIVHAVKKLLFYFPAFALRLLLPTIKKSGTRLIIYDYDDLTIIPSMRWPYLDACYLYFKMHPPINLFKAFLFQTKRDQILWNVLENKRYAAWTQKIKPVSVGTAYKPEFLQYIVEEKKYDVFFSGATHYSQVRKDGLKVLEQLRDEGLRIALPGRIPFPDFMRTCSESWLVLAPEGAEWDSGRPYETLLMKSVPLTNYPTVRRYRPLVDGVHCIFFPPEPGLLRDVILNALKDKERLRRIAQAGHEYVLQHHTHQKIVQYMLNEQA